MMAETSGQVFHTTTEMGETVPSTKFQQTPVHPEGELPGVRHFPGKAKGGAREDVGP